MTNIANSHMDVKGSWAKVEPLVRAFCRIQTAHYGRNPDAGIEARLLPDWGRYEGIRPAATDIAERWGLAYRMPYREMQDLAREIDIAVRADFEAGYGVGQREQYQDKGE